MKSALLQVAVKQRLQKHSGLEAIASVAVYVVENASRFEPGTHSQKEGSSQYSRLPLQAGIKAPFSAQGPLKASEQGTIGICRPDPSACKQLAIGTVH